MSGKSNLYSVYDKKGQYFAPPYTVKTDGLALRAFADAVSDPRCAISAHAEDYDLYCIGEFDDATGFIVPCQPRFMINASVCVSKPAPGGMAGAAQAPDHKCDSENKSFDDERSE